MLATSSIRTGQNPAWQQQYEYDKSAAIKLLGSLQGRIRQLETTLSAERLANGQRAEEQDALLHQVALERDELNIQLQAAMQRVEQLAQSVERVTAGMLVSEQQNQLQQAEIRVLREQVVAYSQQFQVMTAQVLAATQQVREATAELRAVQQQNLQAQQQPRMGNLKAAAMEVYDNMHGPGRSLVELIMGINQFVREHT